jgi:hypothetical protein
MAFDRPFFGARVFLPVAAVSTLAALVVVVRGGHWSAGAAAVLLAGVIAVSLWRGRR